MQSKHSKKFVKNEEETSEKSKAAGGAQKSGFSRPSKTTKEPTEVAASSLAKHRKQTPLSTRRENTTETTQPMTTSIAASAPLTNSTIVDPVVVMVSTPALMDLKFAVLHEDIAHLAYSYWTARGFVHGHAHEDWLRAEAELLAQRS